MGSKVAVIHRRKCGDSFRLIRRDLVMFLVGCPLSLLPRVHTCVIRWSLATGFILALLTFTSAPAPALELSDFISPDDPYYEPIYACYLLGIIKADSSGKFRMNEALNRYQVAHLTIDALRRLDVSIPNGNVRRFPYADVPVGHWAYGDVEASVELGLMGGYEDLSFRGRSNMYTEHWLAMSALLAVKFAPKPDPYAAQEVPDFRDLPKVNWLWEPIFALGHYGWLDPDTMADDFLDRNDVVTRKLFYWYIGKLVLARKGPINNWVQPPVTRSEEDSGKEVIAGD